MTINELKRFLQNVPREKLINIISELYELNESAYSYSKSVNPDNCDNLDQMIFSIVNGGTADLHEKKINFESVKDEIIYFINCAYRGEQSDNREIKSVGAQWRFSVLKYIRILNRTSSSDDEYLESTYLLIEIYKLLAHGCSSDIFSSANPLNCLVQIR